MSENYAKFIHILGRGPTKSRHLTIDEARVAFGGVLSGEMSDLQLGAFLLLLRYRSENPAELAGIVQAVRDHLGLEDQTCNHELIDWPSYSSGKSRRLPWFLLSAKLLAENGVKIFMHGFNSHLENGLTTEDCLSAIGIEAATSIQQAKDMINQDKFAFLPLRHFCPKMQNLLQLRSMLGVRSIINTAVKLINPLNAATITLGIFHPAYIELNIEVAKLLQIPRLGVIKGGGGEAERNILKKIKLYQLEAGQESEINLPAHQTSKPDYPVTLDYLLDIWQGKAENGYATAMITGTAAQALYLTGRAETVSQAEQMAMDYWSNRAGLWISPLK